MFWRIPYTTRKASHHFYRGNQSYVAEYSEWAGDRHHVAGRSGSWFNRRPGRLALARVERWFLGRLWFVRGLRFVGRIRLFRGLRLFRRLQRKLGL
jgi:hypothetical protein